MLISGDKVIRIHMVGSPSFLIIFAVIATGLFLTHRSSNTTLAHPGGTSIHLYQVVRPPPNGDEH
jgi:hypothetical protein